ncbi:MAG: protoporphyrinogen/coproporphyrinogen oxidase [Acidobacteriota bacterium]
MPRHDVIVIGGGVSGASFAFYAARSGRRVLLLEQAERLGGCLHTARHSSGFWLELGAHTCYNSYGALLGVLESCGLLPQLQPRARPRLRFLDGNRVLPGQNLGALMRLMDKRELLLSLPRLIGARQQGETVLSYYSRIVGRTNYRRVLGPMLSAVPSQNADGFPADMLFKKRPRRKDVIRSFTLRGGLQDVVESAARTPGVAVRLGAAVERVEVGSGGFAVTLADSSREEAGMLAVATPPGAAARLLGQAVPELAAQIARVGEVEVASLGLAVPAPRVEHVPASTFLIPLDDVFYSVVTRDVVPDPVWRGFTFHFKPGLSADERLRRACEVLGVAAADAGAAVGGAAILPSPSLGHRDIVREVDRLLAGGRLAITGNWFGGLSIEDCVQRSREEWARIAVA